MTDHVTVFTIDGTHNLFVWGTGALVDLGDNPVLDTVAGLLDPTLCVRVAIDAPSALLPMNLSITDGLAALSTAIAACTGKFILMGYSQGAAIASLALEQLQSGTLTAYADQCIAGVTFGNVCRQEGKVAGAQTDPGGHGLWGNHLLTTTPSWWWDFAMPYDAATTVPDTLFGVDLCTAAEAVAGLFTGGSFITFIAQNWVTGNIQINAEAFGELMTFVLVLGGMLAAPPGMVSFGPHGTYHTAAPPGSDQTCAQLAADYINTTAAAALA